MEIRSLQRNRVRPSRTPIGTGRVPHVRLSVRGPNKTGEAHHSFCAIDQKIKAGQGKAVETYHFRPTYPDFLHGAPPSPACAAFIKESRMKCANASKLYRKSGVRLGELGAPVQFLVGSVRRLTPPISFRKEASTQT